MGRQIRMVPPNWEHPKKYFVGGRYDYDPKHGESYEEACEEWIKGFESWQRGERPKHCSEENSKLYYWDWDSMPPDKDCYVDYEGAEPTWYQVYETVSEGTPVSPPFETQEELIQYLADNGDFCDQRRGDPAWGIERATKFVEHGYAPTLIISNGKIKLGTEL